ncbi:MAG: fibrillarin-like rRNA/tRNA 2'-O-methyltransferase [Candidatus Aenigmarchaeota archaeon]|nr:fibrillarin-like rRNA/tRNA 2'-O-methyltransferase [Candidatus Aenigmarchaeota archaeon]MCX8190897.1 fibrillarin-like rRNA/tRNA 2'-O-methyltransferase [Candidatus Aenigmarchaeota archaeon]MDW8159900.1 fibrillarin-like rRNA/tRNA 2'-O-methyltransferase [Candidatus Aenigmarchaeota archaeon]
MKVEKTNFEGIYLVNGKLATVNTVPGYRAFEEEIVKVGDVEYRIWSPYTSKPAAAIVKGLKVFPLREGMKVLYLGLAAGKTATYFSNIIGSKGIIFGVDIAERVLKDALEVAKKYKNIIPILADARRPETYERIVFCKVDFVYEDVASEDQVSILIKNCQKFLREGGHAAIAIKSQSISSTEDPKVVYKRCLNDLEKHFEVLDKVELDPYEKHHLFVVLQKKQ